MGRGDGSVAKVCAMKGDLRLNLQNLCQVRHESTHLESQGSCDKMGGRGRTPRNLWYLVASPMESGLKEVPCSVEPWQRNLRHF